MKRFYHSSLIVSAIVLAVLALVNGTHVLAMPNAPAINVNSNLVDAPDANPGDTVCETAPHNSICTLRAAIMESNSSASAHTINLQSGATYVLTRFGVDDTALNGDLDITRTLTLNGNNATIDGGGIDRIFDIFSASSVANVSMSNLTIRNGSATSGNGIAIVNGGNLTLTNVVVRDNVSPAAAVTVYNVVGYTLTLTNSTVTHNTALFGAGIRNGGRATLINSTISDNTTGGGPGGGIVNNAGTVVLVNSTVSGNFANKQVGQSNGNGGGIYNTNGGTVTLVNSTLSDNAADDSGGGIFSDGVSSSINLRNTTVAFNYANADAAGTDGAGAGVYSIQGTVNLANSILANNGSFLVSPDDCYGVLNSEGYNLIRTVLAACNIGGNTSGNKTGQDPLLGPLAYNGGATKTRDLLAGSPAIDAGNPGGCTDPLGMTLVTDQRGFRRPVNGSVALRCDIGAVEVQRLLHLPLVVR